MLKKNVCFFFSFLLFPSIIFVVEGQKIWPAVFFPLQGTSSSIKGIRCVHKQHSVREQSKYEVGKSEVPWGWRAERDHPILNQNELQRMGQAPIRVPGLTALRLFP